MSRSLHPAEWCSRLYYIILYYIILYYIILYYIILYYIILHYIRITSETETIYKHTGTCEDNIKNIPVTDIAWRSN